MKPVLAGFFHDLHVASGMEEGVLDSYSRLDELVAEEQAQ